MEGKPSASSNSKATKKNEAPEVTTTEATVATATATEVPAKATVATEGFFHGNLTGEELPTGLENSVVCYITDYGSPRPRDHKDDFKPFKRRMVCSDAQFVNLFASHFEANGAFAGMNTAEKIVRAARNMAPEIVAQQYDVEIESATKKLTSREKRDYIAKMTKDVSTLSVAGSNTLKVHVSDIHHCPGITEENKNEFPEETL